MSILSLSIGPHRNGAAPSDSVVPDTSPSEKFPDAAPVSAKPDDAWMSGLVDGWLGLSRSHGENYFQAKDVRDCKADLAKITKQLVFTKAQREIKSTDLATEQSSLDYLEKQLAPQYRYFNPSRLSFWVQAAVYALVFIIAIFADIRFQEQMLDKLHLGTALSRVSSVNRTTPFDVVPDQDAKIAPASDSGGLAIFRGLTELSSLLAIVVFGFSVKFLHDLLLSSADGSSVSRSVRWLEVGGAAILILLSFLTLIDFGRLRSSLDEVRQKRERLYEIRQARNDPEGSSQADLASDEKAEKEFEQAEIEARGIYDWAFLFATVGLSLFGAVAFIVLVRKHNEHYQVMEMRRALAGSIERRKTLREDLGKSDEAIAEFESHKSAIEERLHEAERTGGVGKKQFAYGYDRANDSPIVFEPSPRFSNLLLRRASRMALRRNTRS